MLMSATVSIPSALPGSIDRQVATVKLSGFSRVDTGSQTLLRFEGAFDALSAPASRSALDTLVSDRRSPVAIDMSAVHAIDSSGVGAVISLYKRVLAQGGQFSVRGLTGQPLAIFQLLHLEHLVTAGRIAPVAMNARASLTLPVDLRLDFVGENGQVLWSAPAALPHAASSPDPYTSNSDLCPL